MAQCLIKALALGAEATLSHRTMGRQSSTDQLVRCIRCAIIFQVMWIGKLTFRFSNVVVMENPNNTEGAYDALSTVFCYYSDTLSENICGSMRIFCIAIETLTLVLNFKRSVDLTG